MRHFGDITKLKGDSLPIVDIVTGGSPCQDLSVAGKRAGLDGERSGLFMEQIRLIKEMRENDRRNKGADVDIRFLRPRFMVWENVPGAFSSNGGEDFRIVLEETAKVAERDACIPRLERGQKWAPSGCILGDGWSIAWRVHDAQFWGVPQRRKRIALVADFGGQTAPEILFECKSVSRNTEESGEERKGTANHPERSFGETISFQERAGCEGGVKESLSNMNGQEHCQHLTTKACCKAVDMYNQSITGDVTMAITGAATDPHHIPCVIDNGPCISVDEKMGNTYIGENVGNTLSARDFKQPQAVVYGLDRASFNQGQNALYDFSIEEEKAQTLVAKGPGGVLTKLSEHYAQEITKE